MIKTGIVTSIDKKFICILTAQGEFVKVKTSSHPPSLGEIYSGQLFTKQLPYMLPVAAAIVFFCMLLGGSILTYYTPVAAVTIRINPSLKMDINRWNKIIKVTPLNEDGKQLVSTINLNNKTIDNGLELIVAEAVKENFISENYKSQDNTISVEIDGKNQKNIILSGFENKVKEENLNVQFINEKIKEQKPSKDIQSSVNKNQQNKDKDKNNKNENPPNNNNIKNNMQNNSNKNKNNSINNNKNNTFPRTNPPGRPIEKR